MNKLKTCLNALKIDINDQQLSLFERYYDMLIDWNTRFNLTAITEKDEVIVKHFTDSASASFLLDSDDRAVDIGSGAGFPSIPLAILRPDVSFTMVDSLNKRVKFLDAVIQDLNLSNCRAVHSRSEDFANTKKGFFDVALARAVAPLPTLLEYLIPLLKVGGKAICYKSHGAKDEIITAQNAASEFGCDIDNVYDFDLPQSDIFRSLVVYKKLKPTPRIYPRGGNKPKSSPIV